MGLYNLICNCSNKAYSSLFPHDVKNRGLVILINLFHILGVVMIQVGILLPPVYMRYYILYLVFLFISYILFISGDIPPCIHNILSSINAEIGK